ncbi:hypothetical protein [Brachyspira sp.]|uniref:hypothetical protein n=1 Tax=Brachyspira sp. TaxID=1977261 RepID=UPI003D7CA010
MKGKTTKNINAVFDTSKYKKKYLNCEIIFSDKKGRLKLEHVTIAMFKKAIEFGFEIDYIKIDNKKYGAVI